MAQDDIGYLIAKLEGIEQRLQAICEYQAEMRRDHESLKQQINDYTSQWKAVRWIGIAGIAIIVVIKTGDVSALKALFAG